MTQKQITLALDPTTETTGNAEQVARMIGCSAWHISGDFLVIENPLLGYKVTDNETYSSPNETTIPDGATIILLEEEQNKLRAGIDKLLETRIPILDQIYDLCLSIEKCGASPELTDAVTKAGALREPITELVNQALELGIGKGIVSVGCDLGSSIAEPPELKNSYDVKEHEPKYDNQSCIGSSAISNSRQIDAKRDNAFLIIQLVTSNKIGIALRQKAEGKMIKLLDELID